MNAPAFENLDLACAKVGKTIAEQPSKELENLITSALAVLEEQGVYALFLYLKVQGKDIGQSISEDLHKFLKNTPQHSPLLSVGNNDIFAALQKLGENLDNLLLARDLIRQSLVYARYHARLREDTETN
jgi:hypothetical protein